jgi:protein associated with RNAse G/E
VKAGNLITVIKLNPERQETWRYQGRILSCSEEQVTLEALFNRSDTPFLDFTLSTGDRFVEVYFNQRWYNIYEIHAVGDGAIKGWYCNIALPAEFYAEEIKFIDLALDLWIYPDKRQVVLDEDEFDTLRLDESTRQQARTALHELQTLATAGALFDLIQNGDE